MKGIYLYNILLSVLLNLVDNANPPLKVIHSQIDRERDRGCEIDTHRKREREKKIEKERQREIKKKFEREIEREREKKRDLVLQ